MAKFIYNSIDFPEDLLKGYEEKSKIDEDMIYWLIKETGGLTKSEILITYNSHNLDIAESSISRSLTNLTDKLLLMKTKDKRIGVWNKSNSIYVEVTDDNIEEAKHILRTTPKNTRLLISELRLLLSTINFVLEHKTDLPDEYSNQLKDIFKQFKKITNKFKSI
jgi:hypothetical protein